MLKFPLWKSIIVSIICTLGVYIALPPLLQGVDAPKLKSVLPDTKVNLGLDLRGGAYILLEVDSESYSLEHLKTLGSQLQQKLRATKIRFEGLSTSKEKISFKLKNIDNKAKAISAVRDALGASVNIIFEGNKANITIPQEVIGGLKDNLILQTIEIIRKRVDESGTKEVDIQRQGDEYILVQVPGIKSPDEIKRLLGKTAKLAFHLVYSGEDADTLEAFSAPKGYKPMALDSKNNFGPDFLFVTNTPAITGEMLVDAQSTLQMGAPVVSFKLNSIGGRAFAEVTAKNRGRQLAIVLDDKIISAPRINDAILGGSGVISGNFTIQSATELAMLLRAGALPAPLKIVEERTVGPSLGSDSIASGMNAVMVAGVAITLIMALYYKFFGMVANIALVFNLILIIATISLLGATLTLPGIAGIVLTLGIAVDANVLIFERIKEELRLGKSIFYSIESGYKMAFATILDSNLTTLLAALLLYMFGAGPIRGFAITLSVGILCSMFTSISLTKFILAAWYRVRPPKKLSI